MNEHLSWLSWTVETNLRTVLEGFSFGRDALILNEHLSWLSWAVPTNLRTVQENYEKEEWVVGFGCWL